jgi:hypothetical protein
MMPNRCPALLAQNPYPGHPRVTVRIREKHLFSQKHLRPILNPGKPGQNKTEKNPEKWFHRLDWNPEPGIASTPT